jgi:hypothetical protein
VALQILQVVFLQMEQSVAIQYLIAIHQTAAVMVVLEETQHHQLSAVMAVRAEAVVVVDLKLAVLQLLDHQAELQQQVTQAVHLAVAVVVVHQQQVLTARQVLPQETAETVLHLQ